MVRKFCINHRWFLILVVLGFFLFFYRVGNRDLWAPDEDEYAQVSREMVQLNHWVYPTVNNQPYTIKPVLYNWLIALASLPWGDVNELRARIFSSIAALGTVMIVFYLGTLMFSRRAGFLGGLVLGTSFLFIQYARWVQINMLATFFIALVLYLFYRGYTASEKRKTSYLMMYVPIGLGVLTMGPVNLILPALVIAFYLIVQKDYNHLKKLQLGWGMLIVLGIIAPYYLIVSFNETYSFDLLVKTNIIRYFDTWTHKRPFYYYLPNLCWAFLPWTLFLPGALHNIFTNRSKENLKDTRFLLVWAVSIFLFFSFSQCKRTQYILPLFPALSLLVAYLGDQTITHWKDSYYKKLVTVPSVVLLVLLSLCAVCLPIYFLIFQRLWLWEIVGMCSILTAITLIILWALQRKRPMLLVVSPGVLMFICILYSLHFVIPKIEAYKSPRPFCQEIVTHLDNGSQWAMYNIFRAAYVYYTNYFCEMLNNEAELKAFLSQGHPSLVVIREKDYKRIKNTLGIKATVLYREKIGHRPMLLISNQTLMPLRGTTKHENRYFPSPLPGKG